MALEFVKLAKGSSVVSQVGGLGFFKLGVESGGADIEFSRTFSENSPATISAISAQISANSMTSAQVEEAYGWKPGDATTIPLTTGENVEMRIIGFNHDDKSDGSGKAGITLEMTHCLETSYTMNSTSTSAGGYPASVLRNTTLPTIKATLPQEWRDVIKMVNKKSANGGTDYTETLTTSEDLFLLSEAEVFASASDAQDGANEGVQYEYWTGKAKADRIKKCDTNADGVTDTACLWWLRSCYRTTSYNFRLVKTTGSVGVGYGNSSYNVSFAFCI